jgi:hypothetical protein
MVGMNLRSTSVFVAGMAFFGFVGGTAQAVTEAEEEAALPKLLAGAQAECSERKVEPELCNRLARFGRAKTLPRLPATDRVVVTRIRTLTGSVDSSLPKETPEYLVLLFTKQGTRLQWFRTNPENDAEKREIEAVMAALAKGEPMPAGSFANVVEQARSTLVPAVIAPGFGGKKAQPAGNFGVLVLRQDTDTLYAFTLEIDTERGGRLSLAWTPRLH